MSDIAAKILAGESLDEEVIDKEIRMHDAKEEAKRRIQARDEVALEILSEAEFDAIPAAQFLVPGLILEGSLGMIVGEPGSLKTFLALDLSLSIVSEQPTWLDRKLTRHGVVVYVLGEGAGRFKYRKDVWKQEHGITDSLPFFIVRRPLNLRNEWEMAKFLKQIDGLPKPIVLIVFDTLNRNMAGGEENSAKELGQAIGAANLLQQSTGATVQLLHHPTKDKTSSRGSGAGKGAADSELWMKKTSSNQLYELSVGKEKEADDNQSLVLKKRIVELAGVYDNGDPVTSCVIELAQPADLTKALASLEQLILVCVKNNPGIKKGEVHSKIGKQKAAVGVAIDQLVQDGSLSAQAKGKSTLLTITMFGDSSIL